MNLKLGNLLLLGLATLTVAGTACLDGEAKPALGEERSALTEDDLLEFDSPAELKAYAEALSCAKPEPILECDLVPPAEAVFQGYRTSCVTRGTGVPGMECKTCCTEKFDKDGNRLITCSPTVCEDTGVISAFPPRVGTV